MPNAAIFADTQCEPDEVYSYLNYLKKKIKNIPIFNCTAGDLVKDTLGRGKKKKCFSTVICKERGRDIIRNVKKAMYL